MKEIGEGSGAGHRENADALHVDAGLLGLYPAGLAGLEVAR